MFIYMLIYWLVEAKMSEKIAQTKITLEGGVNHLQPNAPQGFSLNVEQKEDETLD
jgi:hypothetical protein